MGKEASGDTGKKRGEKWKNEGRIMRKADEGW